MMLDSCLRPQAPRLRRAARRRWGLTARRDRANGATMPQMRTLRCSPALKIRARRTTSDRSSTGFLTSAPWAGRAMRRSHHPGHAQQARPLYVGDREPSRTTRPCAATCAGERQRAQVITAADHGSAAGRACRFSYSQKCPLKAPESAQVARSAKTPCSMEVSVDGPFTLTFTRRGFIPEHYSCST